MPEQSLANRLFDLRWSRATAHERDGIAEIDPRFVFEYPLRVLVLDLRTNAGAIANTGCVPGAVAVEQALLTDALSPVPMTTPIVVLHDSAPHARAAAAELTAAGRERVAVLDGGMAAWRDRGFGVVDARLDLASAIDLLVQRGRTEVNERHLLSEDEVRTHLSDPDNVRVVKLASLLSQGYASCVDGRDERNVVGTPGGNAGELLLSLAAFEQVTGHELSDAEIEETVRDYFTAFGGFYLHTDAHAFDAYTAKLAADERVTRHTGNHTDPLQWVNALRSPVAEIRPILLEHLASDPACIGCGHIRLMLQRGDEYSIRKPVVEAVLRTVYTMWWDEAPEVNLTTLPGGHQEGAVVNVMVDDDVWDYSFIPVISPVCSGTQMFVNHPQFSRRLRESAAEFFARRVKGAKVAKLTQKLADRMMDLGDEQLMCTVGHLAKGLPIYQATYRSDGSWRVEVLA